MAKYIGMVLIPKIGETPESKTDAFDFLRDILRVSDPFDSGEFECLSSDLSESFQSVQMQLAAQSEYHGLTLLIEPAFRFLAGKGKDRETIDCKRSFLALASHHRGSAAAREIAIDSLLAAFAAASIRAILLKGAALAHLIYPAPELRPTLDLDILIDKADRRNAVDIAQKLGYVFDTRYPSRYSGELHHLPAARMASSGFQIFLEIHTTVLSANHRERIDFADVWGNARPFTRGAGLDGVALGHTDMLRHLARHAFEPARRCRLIHLYDIWRYERAFRHEIDWDDLRMRFGNVMVVLTMVSCVFSRERTSGISCSRFADSPSEIGLGFVPLSDVLASRDSLRVKLLSLLNPPVWWLHGFYGVPLGTSLLLTRIIRHPATLLRWLLTRVFNGAEFYRTAALSRPD